DLPHVSFEKKVEQEDQLPLGCSNFSKESALSERVFSRELIEAGAGVQEAKEIPEDKQHTSKARTSSKDKTPAKTQQTKTKNKAKDQSKKELSKGRTPDSSPKPNKKTSRKSIKESDRKKTEWMKKDVKIPERSKSPVNSAEPAFSRPESGSPGDIVYPSPRKRTRTRSKSLESTKRSSGSRLTEFT
ncbi:hypothetical protein PMAYCL1PPCAC_26814, partial [Pristionchus mayeri]